MKQNPNPLALGVLFAALLLAQAQSPCFASAKFDDGLAQFNARRYRAAAEIFTELERQNPNDQKIHMYMGKTLEQLKDRSGAQAEYEACFRINPFTDLGLEAKKAMLNLSQAEAARARAPLDDVKTVERTINTIQRQTATAKANYMSWGNAYSRQRLRTGQQASQYYIDHTNRTLHDIRRQQNYDPYYANHVSNWGIIQSHYAYMDSHVQARRAAQWGANHARLLQESANNLMAQIDQRGHLPDAPVLRAKGTNLYVRYYGSPEQEDDDTPPQDPPEQLRAVAKKLKLR